MDINLINIIIGYFIIINLISITLIWIKAKTDFIQIPNKIMNWIFIVLSMIGGFIGTLVGSEMMGYERDNKIFKRWIPFIIFVEVCAILYMFYKINA